MISKSEFKTKDNVQIEVSTIEFNGHKFSNLGSIVDMNQGYIVGYVKNNELLTWDGSKVICKLIPTSTWKTPYHIWSTTMTSYRAVIDGKVFTGKGSGEGMLLRLRTKKTNRKTMRQK